MRTLCHTICSFPGKAHFSLGSALPEIAEHGSGHTSALSHALQMHSHMRALTFNDER
jgi:hypothetical protein